MRIAQQVGDPSARRAGADERFLQRVQRDSSLGVERRLHDPAPGVRDERVERRVYRRVDDDRVAGLGDKTQDLDDAEHDVGNDCGATYFDVVPLPTAGSEFADRLGERGA